MKKIKWSFLLVVFVVLAGCAAVPMQTSMMPGASEVAIKPSQPTARINIAAAIQTPLTPLPKSIKIVPPQAGIPEDITMFLGIWQGIWNEILPTALVVEEISSSDVAGTFDVTGIFANGPNKNEGKSTWIYFEGKISSGKLTFGMGNSVISYTSMADGELSGTFKVVSPDGRNMGVLRGAMTRREK